MSSTGNVCIYEFCFNKNASKTVSCGFANLAKSPFFSVAILKLVSQMAIDSSSIGLLMPLTSS